VAIHVFNVPINEFCIIKTNTWIAASYACAFGSVLSPRNDADLFISFTFYERSPFEKATDSPQACWVKRLLLNYLK
jgi:hypothetical protein